MYGDVLKASVLLTNQSGYTGCKHIVVRYYRTTTLLGACLLCTKVETFSWCWFCHERLNGESRQDHIEHKSKALFSFQTNWRAYITWQMPLANCNAFRIWTSIVFKSIRPRMGKARQSTSGLWSPL